MCHGSLKSNKTEGKRVSTPNDLPPSLPPSTTAPLLQLVFLLFSMLLLPVNSPNSVLDERTPFFHLAVQPARIPNHESFFFSLYYIYYEIFDVVAQPTQVRLSSPCASLPSPLPLFRTNQHRFSPPVSLPLSRYIFTKYQPPYINSNSHFFIILRVNLFTVTSSHLRHNEFRVFYSNR